MMKKRIISLALVVVILLLMSSQVFCIGYESEYKENAVASNDLVVIVPGIVASELVDIDDIKVWVGVGLLASKIDCNEVGNPVYP